MTTPRRVKVSTLLQTRDGTPANKDARLTNCIIEQDGEDLNCLKRPGYAAYTSPATGTGGGATMIQDSSGAQQMMSIINDTLYVTQNTVSTSWTASGGTTNFGGGNVRPLGLLYFKNLFWVLNPNPGDASAGSTAVYSSSDTITWTQVSANGGYNNGFNRSQFGSCVFKGKMWVIGGINNSSLVTDVWSSADGVTWTKTVTSAGWTAITAPNVIVYANKMWVVGSRNGGGGTTNVWSTSDGVTWTQATAVGPWSAGQEMMVYVFAGKMWVAGGLQGATYYNALYSSTDGISWTSVGNAAWTARASAQFYILNNIAYVATGRTAAGTYSKDLWQSGDGITWTQVTSDITIAGAGGAASRNSVASSVEAMTSFIVANNTVYVFGQWLSTGASSTIYIGNASATTQTVGQLSFGGSYDWSQTLDRTQIAIKNTAAAWNFTVAGSALASVTNANYPATTVRGLVYLDGSFYVMDSNGAIWGSSPNDFTTWSAINFINAQSESDGGVCLIKYNQYIVAFGQYTVEFFYDAGNAIGSPLSPVQNAQLLIGCASADSVQQVASSVFFIGQSKLKGQAFSPKLFVARLDGTQYTVVSTPSIDRILNADGLVGAFAASVNILGHSIYIISLPTTNVSLAFDVKIGTWYIWTIGTLGSAQTIGAGNLTYTTQADGNALVSCTLANHGFNDGDQIIMAGATQTAYNDTFNVTVVDANTFTYVAASVPAATPATGSPTAQGSSQSYFPLLTAFSYLGSQIFQSVTDGHLYTMSETTYTDNSVFIDTHMRMERFDQGLSENGNSQNKFLHWLDIVTDKTSVSTKVLVRYSDNDYQTYSKYRSVDISLERARVGRLGSFIRRAFELRHTASSALRFQAMDMGIEQGGE